MEPRRTPQSLAEPSQDATAEASKNPSERLISLETLAEGQKQKHPSESHWNTSNAGPLIESCGR